MKIEIPYARRIGSHIEMSYFLYCFATSYMPVTFGSLSLNQKSLACCEEGSQICVWLWSDPAPFVGYFSKKGDREDVE